MTDSHTSAPPEAVRSYRIARRGILAGAFLSFAFSITLWFTGSRDEGLFVGLWVPSILALGSLLLPPSER